MIYVQKKKKRNYEFCYHCLTEWKGNNCSNSECGGVNPRLSILANAINKTIGSVSGVPSIRACVRCGYIIEHLKDCKHMRCPFCDCEFCFVCLTSKMNSKWPDSCGAYDAVCSIAPHQTALPFYSQI